MHDPTFELQNEKEAEWNDEIPIDGSILPKNENIKLIIKNAISGSWQDWPLDAVGGYLLDYMNEEEALDILDYISAGRSKRTEAFLSLQKDCSYWGQEVSARFAKKNCANGCLVAFDCYQMWERRQSEGKNNKSKLPASAPK